MSAPDPGSDDTVIIPPGGSRGAGFAQTAAPVRHTYKLTVRSAGFWVAVGLVVQSLPYALARFGVLLACSLLTLIWLVVMIGGAAWLGTHIAGVFGWIWFIGFLVLAGAIWGSVLRYVLHLIDCGHVAVLTDLITKGSVGNGQESMFAYGRRVVTARFGEASLLFGLNAMVRGIVESFHRTLDWIGELLPIPGLESISSVVNWVMKAATRYLDKVIFSYNLARGDADPWTSSREGLIYYCQNARPVLTTALWSVVLERVMSVVLWLVLLVPAGLITLGLPASTREFGGFVTVLVAFLLVGPIRAAFIKPVFLVMMMVRFHACVENQPINAEWDARLSTLSENFRNFGRETAARMGMTRWGRMFS